MSARWSTTCLPSAASTQTNPELLVFVTTFGPHDTSEDGRICKNAGIPWHKTNHSLRATTATRLYQSGVDEQLVERTGHRSLDGVRSYKRTSASQREALSDILNRQGTPSTVTERSTVTVQSSKTASFCRVLVSPLQPSHTVHFKHRMCQRWGIKSETTKKEAGSDLGRLILRVTLEYTAQNCKPSSCYHYQHIYLPSHTQENLRACALFCSS